MADGSSGLAHAQFETIHPFLDGNGRVGRLLITFFLVHRGVLRRPLLYRLTAIRSKGDWEGWLRFVRRGVGDAANEAIAAAKGIITMREQSLAASQATRGLGRSGNRLLDLMFRRLILNVRIVQTDRGISFNAAARLVERAEAIGWLREMTRHKRNRVYSFDRHLSTSRATGVSAKNRSRPRRPPRRPPLRERCPGTNVADTGPVPQSRPAAASPRPTVVTRHSTGPPDSARMVRAGGSTRPAIPVWMTPPPVSRGQS